MNEGRIGATLIHLQLAGGDHETKKIIIIDFINAIRNCRNGTKMNDRIIIKNSKKMRKKTQFRLC